MLIKITGESVKFIGSKVYLRELTSHSSRTFHRSKPICIQCHSKPGNGCFTILFDGAYFLLAVMVEGDDGRWFGPATGP